MNSYFGYSTKFLFDKVTHFDLIVKNLDTMFWRKIEMKQGMEFTFEPIFGVNIPQERIVKFFFLICTNTSIFFVSIVTSNKLYEVSFQ